MNKLLIFKLEFENIMIMNLHDLEYLNDNFVHFVLKNKKSENDAYSSIREKVINLFITYFEKGIPKENQCFELFQNFKQTMMTYGITGILNHKKKGGRKNTFDFILDCRVKHEVKSDLKNDDQDKKEVIFEFKNNSDKVDNLPEFLQLYTTNKEIKITKLYYHQYYYEHFLPKVLEFVENKYNKKLILPTYEIYLKDINNTNKKKETFHQSLYTFYKRNPKAMNEIVKESIKQFLLLNTIYEIEMFNEKLKEQENKLFLLHKNGKFYLDQIKDHMKINKFKEIKNNNTIVFETSNQSEIHCLLRWKNGNGCIGPAWQIKLVFK
jgi:hypothetical protein